MVRLKFIQRYKQYQQGDVVYVTRNEAHGYIDGGYAIISKDMVRNDYKTKRIKK